jgi:sulfite reductase beta subunit-like hemoprotein
VGGGTAIFARPALTLTGFVAVEEYLRLAEAVLRVFDGCEELRHNRQRARTLVTDSSTLTRHGLWKD